TQISLGRSYRRQKIVTHARGASYRYAEKIGTRFFVGTIGLAVEPADLHVGVGPANDETDLAAGFEAIFHRERANFIAVISALFIAPENPAHLARLAAGR